MRERAIFLILASALLLGAFALAGPPAEEGPVTLAVATDLHYISPRLTDGGEAFLSVVENADGKAMPRIDELVRAFAAEMAASGPDALIITGDLSFNGARLSHEDLAEILAGIEEAGVPVYVIPGNHDLDSSQAARFEGDTVTLVESAGAAEFREIYRDFGFGEALSEDSASLSYTARIAPGLRLLCVDVNGSRTPGWVSDETLEWAEAQLAEARPAGGSPSTPHEHPAPGGESDRRDAPCTPHAPPWSRTHGRASPGGARWRSQPGSPTGWGRGRRCIPHEWKSRF